MSDAANVREDVRTIYDALAPVAEHLVKTAGPARNHRLAAQSLLAAKKWLESPMNEPPADREPSGAEPQAINEQKPTQPTDAA